MVSALTSGITGEMEALEVGDIPGKGSGHVNEETSDLLKTEFWEKGVSKQK